MTDDDAFSNELSAEAFRAALAALKANDRQPVEPLRYFALPNELAALGGAERLGRSLAADEVWSRPPIGEAPLLLWSLKSSLSTERGGG